MGKIDYLTVNEGLCSATLHYRPYWFDWINQSKKE